MNDAAKKKPRLLIFYHYFYPDNVVSSCHLSQLGEELKKRGWDVTAMPCNRGCRDETAQYKAVENWNGIEILRVWRPGFRQSSSHGRVLNAVWMILAWCLTSLRKKKVPDVDVLVVGTDPIFSVFVATIWKWFRPNTKVTHWCFDLYPEAAVAERILKPESVFVRVFKRLLKSAYRACDLIVDIGICMRKRLQAYNVSARMVTLVPWALVEPGCRLETDLSEREKIFGSTKLAITYSGNFGRAHSYELFLDLARYLRDEDVKFSFSIRGNRADELKNAVMGEGDNTNLVPFAPMDKLQARLSASDIHLVSLQPEWTGTVVPSKFFGSLAVGRPVIFVGSQESALAEWVRVYKVGWVLNKENLILVGNELAALSKKFEQLRQLQEHCYRVYQEHFSKEQIANKWNRELRAILS